jgi:hypothetical protein
MPKTRRRRADREQYWRDTIAAWEESGQSISAFCADRGVGQATFFTWRRKLARRDPAPCSAAPVTPIPSFAAVRVIPEPAIEVVLPVGLVVRVPAGADPAAVARLVAALGGGPC